MGMVCLSPVGALPPVEGTSLVWGGFVGGTSPQGSVVLPCGVGLGEVGRVLCVLWVQGPVDGALLQ